MTVATPNHLATSGHLDPAKLDMLGLLQAAGNAVDSAHEREATGDYQVYPSELVFISDCLQDWAKKTNYPGSVELIACLCAMAGPAGEHAGLRVAICVDGLMWGRRGKATKASIEQQLTCTMKRTHPGEPLMFSWITGGAAAVRAVFSPQRLSADEEHLLLTCVNQETSRLEANFLAQFSVSTQAPARGVRL